MALFSRTKKKAVETKENKTLVPVSLVGFSPRASVISSVRITEKATKESEQNVYTFNILPGATKTEVKEAIRKLYKVSPVKVSIVSVRSKALFQKGKRGRTAGGKKAYVTLKKGDKIEFI